MPPCNPLFCCNLCLFHSPPQVHFNDVFPDDLSSMISLVGQVFFLHGMVSSGTACWGYCKFSFVVNNQTTEDCLVPDPYGTIYNMLGPYNQPVIFLVLATIAQEISFTAIIYFLLYTMKSLYITYLIDFVNVVTCNTYILYDSGIRICLNVYTRLQLYSN